MVKMKISNTLENKIHFRGKDYVHFVLEWWLQSFSEGAIILSLLFLCLPTFYQWILNPSMQGKDFNVKLPGLSDHYNSCPPGSSSVVSFSQTRVKETFLHPGAIPSLTHTHTHIHTHTHTHRRFRNFFLCLWVCSCCILISASVDVFLGIEDWKWRTTERDRNIPSFLWILKQVAYCHTCSELSAFCSQRRVRLRNVHN